MQQNIAKWIGLLQGVLGAGGAAVPDVAQALGTGMGNNLVNLVSGALMSYLGFKGSAGGQSTGLKAIGALNALVGGLGAGGVLSNLGGLAQYFPQDGNANWIHLALGAISLIGGFMGGKKSA